MNSYKEVYILKTIKEEELESFNFSQLANYGSQSLYLAGRDTELRTPSAK